MVRLALLDDDDTEATSSTTNTLTISTGGGADPVAGEQAPPAAVVAVEDEAPPPEPAEGDSDPDASAAGGRFKGIAITADQWTGVARTGDKRFYEAAGGTWRPLPLPVLGIDRNTEGHDEAVVVGHITELTWDGPLLRYRGVYGTHDFAQHMRTLVGEEHITGVSVDLDELEVDVIPPDGGGDPMLAMLFGEEPVEQEEAPTAEGPDGEQHEVIQIESEAVRVSQWRVIGLTICPFPGYLGAFIENDDEPAEPEPAEDEPITAAGITPPLHPPRAWFDELALTDYEPWTITDHGEVFGHVASWSDCHISFLGQCVPPPRSLTGYAHFLAGETICDDGTRIATGVITCDTGHAELADTAAAAKAHYDDTGTIIANVVIGEDDHGIWIHGALDPDVSANALRRAMAVGVSGDWRPLGQGKELVGINSAPVRGFNRAVARARMVDGLVASVIIPLEAAHRSGAHGLDKRTVRSLRQQIAASIGRSKADRRAALRAEVHG